MTIPPIGPTGFTPYVPPTIATDAAAPTTAGVDKASAVAGAPGVDFAQLLANGIENLQGLHDRADQLAVQAATGALDSLHDYTIAATEAATATQLTTAVRNKALEAFQEIMRMPI
jgi:flagellar hook-basal body complex protein FliE